MKKKLLSMVMALVMVLSLLPAGAMAAETAAADADSAAAMQLLEEFQSSPEKTWSQLYGLVLRAKGLVGGSVNEAAKNEIKSYLATLEELTLTGAKAYQTSFPDLGVLDLLTGLKNLTITDAMDGSAAPLDLGALKGLTKLENLVLSGKNNIADIGALEKCVSLKTLDLSGNSSLMDFGVLVFTKNLETLNLSGTGFSDKDFDALRELSRLENLNISSTKASDLNGLAAKASPCNSLKVLDISDTSIRSLDPLMKGETSVFPALTTLTAKGLELDSIAGLAKAVTADGTKLTDCDMSGSSVVGDQGGTDTETITQKLGPSFKAPLANAPAENDVTKAEIWQTKFLKDLGNDGGKTALTWDTLIAAVYWYRQAQAYLEANSADTVADYGKLQERMETLTNCYKEQVTKLDMSGKTESQYTISTGALTDFEGLKELNLSGTGLDDFGGLKKLAQLEKLNLSGNSGVTASCFGALIGLSLEELNLSGTGVTEIGGMSGAMPGVENKLAASLKTLDISNTPVTRLEGLWSNGTAMFPALTTLTAQNLTGLTSISGLADWAGAEGAAAEIVKWDLGGGRLTCSDAQTQVDTIKTVLSDKFTLPAVVATNYTIKFVAGEETATGTMTDAAYPKANAGATNYVLPECAFTAEGKTFKGWVVANPTDKSITLSANTLVIPEAVEAGTVITLTAQWLEAEAETKDITVANADNGTVKILVAGTELTGSGLKAAEGTVVTVQATPDEGYQVNEIKVAQTEGQEVTVTNGAFEMPGAAVTVTVTFKPGLKTPLVDYTAVDVVVGETGKEVTVTTDGAVTAASSDTSVAAVSYSGQTVTITGVAPGTATVTINADKSDAYAANRFTVSVTVTAKAGGGIAITLDTTGLKAGGSLPEAKTTAKGVKLNTVWKNSKNEVVTTVEAGETYTPTVTVELEEGYKLPDGMTYTVNGETVTLSGKTLVKDGSPSIIAPVVIPSDAAKGKITCQYSTYEKGTDGYKMWASGKLTLTNLTKGRFYLVQTASNKNTDYRLYQIVEAKDDGTAELSVQTGSVLWLFDAGTDRDNMFSSLTPVFNGVSLTNGTNLQEPAAS